MRVISAAARMRKVTECFKQATSLPLSIRFGLASGTVIGGVIGSHSIFNENVTQQVLADHSLMCGEVIF